MNRREFLRSSLFIGAGAFLGYPDGNHAEYEPHSHVDVPPTIMFHARHWHLEMPPQFLDMLSRAGYQTITYGDLQKTLFGNKPLPEKPVILTFDDITFAIDRQNVAFPMQEKMEHVLARHNARGVFAAVTEPILGNSRIIQDEEKWKKAYDWIHKDGMEIVTHTKNHLNLGNRDISYATIHGQIADSQSMIEGYTNQEVNTLVLPYGNGTVDRDKGIMLPNIVSACENNRITFVAGIAGGRRPLSKPEKADTHPVYFVGRVSPGQANHENASAAMYEVLHWRK